MRSLAGLAAQSPIFGAGGPPPGTPYLDALPLTLNCRPGGLVVTGQGGAGDHVQWVSRPSASPRSATVSLFRSGNTVNTQGALKGNSTLVVPAGASYHTGGLTVFDAVPTVERTADYVLSAAVGQDATTQFTLLLLARFAKNTAGSEIMGLGDFSAGRASMKVNAGTLTNQVWFGSDTQSVPMRAAPPPVWQVLFFTFFQTGNLIDAAINRDVASSSAAAQPVNSGCTGNPFIVGPFTAFADDLEIGGVWGTHAVLTAGDRFAIVDELRVFTGEPLA